MKLTTEIKPRKDGTVTARVGAASYTFKTDETGALVAEVDQGDLGALLDTGNFYPADEADIEAGIVAVDEQHAVKGADEAGIEVKNPVEGKPAKKKVK